LQISSFELRCRVNASATLDRVLLGRATDVDL
jgi:hypothetical protein